MSESFIDIKRLRRIVKIILYHQIDGIDTKENVLRLDI